MNEDIDSIDNDCQKTIYVLHDSTDVFFSLDQMFNISVLLLTNLEAIGLYVILLVNNGYI